MRPGLDLLGLAHPLFPFDRALREIPKDTPIGWFWNAFGSSNERFRALIAAGFKTFRIQCWWSDAHALVPGNVLKVILEEINRETRGKDINLYISPSCEHADRNASEVKKRLQMVRDIVPHAKVVNNPWKGHGANVPGFLHEYHGGNPGTCDLASTDGTNIYDIDAASWVKRYGNREHPCFLWGARFNLREIGDPGQKPPPIKNRKAAPGITYLRSVIRLTEPFGTAPKPSFSFQKLAAPEIYKTHAEDDQETNEDTPDELRENRPVLIIKPNVRAVDILDVRGQVIGRLPKYGSYPGGLTRYYSGLPGGIALYGYEIGRKAKASSGSEFVWFRAGRTIYGPINPAFRAGLFRT